MKEQPAFPVTTHQYFAGQALMGMLANPNIRTDCPADKIASWSLDQADAMIAEYERREKEGLNES